MKLIVLGSGNFFPNKARNHSAYFLKLGKKNLLLDCGSGTFLQMARTGLDYKKIDHFLITHFHCDHVNDLAAFLLAAQNDPAFKKNGLSIIGPHGMNSYYSYLMMMYPFLLKENFEVQIKEVREDHLHFEDFTVKATVVKHTDNSLAYRIEQGKKSLVYTGDTGYCQSIVALAENADILIAECADLKKQKPESHLSPESAAQIAKEANVKKLVLSHLPPTAKEKEIVKRTKKVFKGTIIVAKDFMKLQV